MISTGAFAALLVLGPAVLRWWWARGLSRHYDDPALPERLIANQRRNQIILFFAIVMLIYWSPIPPLVGVPVMLVARAGAAFPFRKRLYGETWTFLTFLSFFTRLIIGVYGFWLLLLCTPTIAKRFGHYDWIAGLVLCVVLIAWHERSTAVLRWMLRARPITDPGLLPKFEEMGRATCPDTPPRFEYVDMNGGAVANAVALPSLRGSGALFSSTLLALLDREEIIAICAHELAHLEYYSPAWLRRARLIDLGLIVIAAATSTLSRIAFPSFPMYGELPILALMLVTLLSRAKDRQKNETASDLRAVALCGNGDALARGLTKLYTFARIPRRWDVQREQSATHPSLARRIRDIRAANGIAPAPVGPNATFGVSERTGVTFNDTRVEWRESEGVSHSLSYAHLSELRVHAGTSGPVKLVAVEKTGRRWEMPLRREEVASVQAVLDSVDGRLASVPSPRVSTNVTWLVKFICVSVSLSMMQITCGLITLFSFWRPSSNMLAAAGVASIVSGLLSIRQWRGFEQYPIGLVMAGVMTVIGGGLLLLARTTRRDETDPAPTRPIVSLGVVAALMLILLGIEGVNPVRLHQNAVEFPAVTIVLFAFAGALVSDRRRQVRLAGIAPAVLGAAVAGAGSLTFLDYVARDPFLVAAGSAVVRPFEGAPSSEMKVSFDVAALRLSPGGRALAAQEDEEDRDDPGARGLTFHVGRVGDALRKLSAEEVAFIDDNRALALHIVDGAADVRAFTVADPDATIWSARIPDVISAGLLAAPDGDWHVVGWTRARTMVSAAGRVGQTDIARIEWPVAGERYGWGQAMTAAGQKALFLDTAYQTAPFHHPLLIGFYAASRSHMESRLWHIVDGERHMAAVSRLEVSCSTGSPTGAGLVCSAFDGARTRIVSIDTATARVRPVSMFWGRFRASTDGAAAGWVTGWLDSTPVALRLATNEALQISQRPREWIRAVAATDGAIGTVSSGVGGARIRVYPLDYRSARR